MRGKTVDLIDGGRLAAATLPGRSAGYLVKEPAESAGHIIVARSMAASWVERAERHGMTGKKVLAVLNGHFGKLEAAAYAAVTAKAGERPAPPVAEILRPEVPSWMNTTPPAALGLPDRRRRERAAWIERAAMDDQLQFGRHKGKTITEVVVIDRRHADWLLVQPWFSEKFPGLVAAIHEARTVPAREEARA